MRVFLFAVCTLSALLVASAGCSVDPGATGGIEEELRAQEFRIATFNAGLVKGGVALYEQRLPHVAPALIDTDADVLCLQEVWSDADYERLRGELAPAYPHAFRERTNENGKRWFSCNPFKLKSLKTCVDSKCAPSGTSVNECVKTACKSTYEEMSEDCQTCLAANTGSPTKCILVADEYVEAGRNGLALFSKHPIEDARYEAYGTALVHRGFLRADIAGKAIACTHLTADLDTVPYPNGHPWSSWVEEQQAQVDRVTSSLPKSGCRIALGDFNSSPDAGPIRPEVPETIAAFERAGFREPWDSPTCTWCAPPENPLASGREARLIDHVLVSGCGNNVSYERILDAPISVEHDGRALETRLSDHFGLMATMRR